MPAFLERLAEVPELLDALYFHPDGLTFAQLAREVGRDEAAVREALLAYYNADLAGHVDDAIHRPDVIDFEREPGDDEDSLGSRVVLVVSSEPGLELGVAYRSASDLLQVYRAGVDQLQLEPDNRILRNAVERLSDELLPEVQRVGPSPAVEQQDFHQAARENHRVRISYARAWEPGTAVRVIDPYRLVRTRRGWEVDAGPVQDGRIRTFLLTGILSYDVLEEAFEAPADLAELLVQQRKTTAVTFEVPHRKHWAVDKQAERVRTVRSDSRTVRLEAQLLEPLERRVGLILLDAGPTARVVEPTDYADAGRRCAAPLLESYGEAP